MKTRILILSAVFSIMAISCSKDNNDVDKTTITAEEAGINSKADAATDDVTGISENQINNIDANTVDYKSSIEQSPFAPPCATVTRVPAFGTTPTAGQLVTKTIDFGTTGCALGNGNTVKGKIIITFNYNLPVNNWTVTFDNFYHNNIKVNGTKTYTRTMVGTPAHPKVTVDINITITLYDGRVLTRTGQRVREFITGYGTSSITDDVHQVTGSWTTTFPNTTTQTATITSPILLKMSCFSPTTSILSQGIITYVRGRHNASLDFGDGTCDNIAIFTKDGISVQINIGR